jgi:hypothetical protein
MKRSTIITWILLVIFSKVLAYTFYAYKIHTGIEIIPASYYKFGALHDILAAGLVYMLVRYDVSMRIVAGYWLALAGNQLLDEFLFDPTKFQANELFFALAATVYTIYELSHVCKKKQTSHRK